ncbi:MAG TPA: chemotaxis protein CheW [Gemmatimonadaceae bacterium]
MSSDSTATAPDASGDRLLIVELRGGLYGIDSTTVREIVGVLDATRLPGAPPHVRGVVNLRGLLLTVVDLGHRLTGTPTLGAEGSIVVTAANDRSVGVVVDDVHDVQEVAVVPVEREVLARADGLLTGVGRLGDEVVLVVDIPELIRQTLA